MSRCKVGELKREREEKKTSERNKVSRRRRCKEILLFASVGEPFHSWKAPPTITTAHLLSEAEWLVNKHTLMEVGMCQNLTPGHQSLKALQGKSSRLKVRVCYLLARLWLVQLGKILTELYATFAQVTTASFSADLTFTSIKRNMFAWVESPVVSLLSWSIISVQIPQQLNFQKHF